VAGKQAQNQGKTPRWRKLHLGLDRHERPQAVAWMFSGEIVCSDLTADDVGDPTALPELLDQIGGPVDKFIARWRL